MAKNSAEGKMNGGGQLAIAIQGTLINRGENSGPNGAGVDDSGAMFTLTKSDQHAVPTDMAVRRLTPRECERLQGFPDDYTKISDKTADAMRYKALGNSMAVPVMRWIGEQIQLVDSSI